MNETLKLSGPLAAVLLLCSCGGSSPSATNPGPEPDGSRRLEEAATMEWKGQFSGVERPAARVIRTPADWAETWADIGATPPQTPDFKTYIGAAVFLGQRNTGGHGIRWLEPQLRGDRLDIFYRETKPTGLTMQVITQPYAVKLFPRERAVDAVVAETAP